MTRRHACLLLALGLASAPLGAEYRGDVTIDVVDEYEDIGNIVQDIEIPMDDRDAHAERGRGDAAVKATSESPARASEAPVAVEAPIAIDAGAGSPAAGIAGSEAPAEALGEIAAPVESAPIDAVPADAVPAESALEPVTPLDTVPADAAPIDAVPIDVSPVEQPVDMAEPFPAPESELGEPAGLGAVDDSAGTAGDLDADGGGDSGGAEWSGNQPEGADADVGGEATDVYEGPGNSETPSDASEPDLSDQGADLSDVAPGDATADAENGGVGEDAGAGIEGEPAGQDGATESPPS